MQQNESKACADASITKDVVRYIQPVADVSRAERTIVELLNAYFAAKNRHHIDEFMEFFSPDMSAYSDATLGWKLASFDAMKGLLAQYMPNWGNGVSYPVRILGGPDTAVVAVTDTPELFGGEIHSLGCVDVRNGKITRWIDYWDSCEFDGKVLESSEAPPEHYPSEFGEHTGSARADATITAVCNRLHQLLGVASATPDLSQLFAYDAVYEDVAMRVLLSGRSAIGRYFGRLCSKSPFGAGAIVRHIAGGETGGGYEWVAAPDWGVKAGLTALELSETGLITRFTTTYDARRLGSERRLDLAALTLDPLP